MTPSSRTAVLLAVAGTIALVAPVGAAVLAFLAVAAATAVDAWTVRRPPRVRRQLPSVLARRVPGRLEVVLDSAAGGRVRVRQPLPPDLAAEPAEANEGLVAALVAHRRGRHGVPPAVVRCTGPLGLGRWDHEVGTDQDVVVYPDVVEARRIAQLVRRGRLAEQGRFARGPLGLGTDFESIRDYAPDDDVRQINWLASSRVGRPMSNVYRVDQDRDVVCLIDTGRLMAAPLDPLTTRLDAAVDAAVAVAFTADVVGDHSGVIAFDTTVRRRIKPRRAGARAVVRAVFDVEPVASDSDYELAFKTVAGAKRAFVLVLTDLLDEAAARPLVGAVPILARRHAVAVASAADPDLGAAVTAEPSGVVDAYEAVVAAELLEARSRAAASLRAAGADVIEAHATALPQACVAAYLRAKTRARA